MVRSKELSEAFRKEIVDAYESGKRYKKISKELVISHSTVQKIIYKWRTFKTTANMARYEIRDTHLVEESVLETLKVKADFLTFKPRPFNMREFYDRTGHDIKDMLLSCYYRGDKCSAEDFKV
ncbi:hypothetical protein QTP86_013822, partial [Hemibagrus guttatus]